MENLFLEAIFANQLLYDILVPGFSKRSHKNALNQFIQVHLE